MQGVILGTAAYMAPEQARGKPIDKRADIWAFGVVLFEMLAGRRAFEGEDVSDTLAAILRGEPDWRALPPGTPPHVRRVPEQCLQRDRKRGCATSATSSWRSTNRTRRCPRPSRRRRVSSGARG